MCQLHISYTKFVKLIFLSLWSQKIFATICMVTWGRVIMKKLTNGDIRGRGIWNLAFSRLCHFWMVPINFQDGICKKKSIFHVEYRSASWNCNNYEKIRFFSGGVYWDGNRLYLLGLLQWQVRQKEGLFLIYFFGLCIYYSMWEKLGKILPLSNIHLKICFMNPFATRLHLYCKLSNENVASNIKRI